MNKWIMENDFLLEWIRYWNRIMKIIKVYSSMLDKVKFSQSDQYLCYYKVLTILDILSFL